LRAKRDNLTSLFHGSRDYRLRLGAHHVFTTNDQKVKTIHRDPSAVMREIVAAADWSYTSRNPLIPISPGLLWETSR